MGGAGRPFRPGLRAFSATQAMDRIAAKRVLLAVPESVIFNSETLHNILMTTYRHEQSVIGFSAAFVRAGALATTFSTIDDIAAQLEEIVHDFASSGDLATEQFPRYFDVVVNDSVAKSLNLVVGEEVKRLRRKPVRKDQ